MTLIVDVGGRPRGVRSVASVEAELRAMLADGAIDLPRPGGGSTA